MATKTSLKKWIFILSVSIAITPTIYFVKCKIFLTFQCLSWALQLTLFTINHNEFTGMEKEEMSSWSWGFVLLSMLRTVCKHAFWGRLLTIIVSSDFPLKLEYYFLSRICNVVCRELCAVLSANLHYFSLSLSQTEWTFTWDVIKLILKLF